MKYDIAIIGGGPAGLMAASRAGELGAKVVLLEKNSRLGTKLLLTGGGRCNLTNNISDPAAFISCLGPKAKFLFSGLNKFGVKETLAFFQSHGLKIKVEKNNRVFPVSNSADEVLDIFIKNLRNYQVEIRTKGQVNRFITEDNKIIKLVLSDGREIEADKFILATGGKSYPGTGSDGDGYKWLAKMGHTIIDPQPSLTPLLVEADFIKELEGLSVIGARLTLYQGSKKISSTSGDVIFTSTGLSGPAALDLSRHIDSETINDLDIEIDFLPQLEIPDLDKKLQSVLMTSGKQLKNSLEGLVVPKFRSVLFKLCQIDPNEKSNCINRQQRLAMVKILKNFKLQITALAGFDKAMITKGGLALNEVDPKTMQSKIISNLYICGEVLDLDGPTGGFNLQICWTTGFIAGESAN
jgi:predicted Rossmann fold flavoprotein